MNLQELSAALLYGKGVFSTVAIHRSPPFLWDKHWRRLTQDAERIGIDLSEFSEETVHQALADVIEGLGADGRVRITFYDQRPGVIWPADDAYAAATTMSIVVAKRRSIPQPFNCFVSPHTLNSRSPLAGIKSCNYLENILALEDAKRRGCGEAVRLNERGHVAGACMANVFWLKGDRLFTPSLSTGCLPGTTREFVMENLECEEVEATAREIENAEAVFLTSAGLGVIAVDEFNGRKLSATDHPILKLISYNL